MTKLDGSLPSAKPIELPPPCTKTNQDALPTHGHYTRFSAQQHSANHAQRRHNDTPDEPSPMHFAGQVMKPNNGKPFKHRELLDGPDGAIWDNA
ncbi:MAG: hypothetical protein AAGJ35_15285, partial [Myxococcota bacterium]